MSDTSFQKSLGIVKALEVDFRARCKEIQQAYEDEMAPLRAEFARKRAKVEAKRKNSLARLERWRLNIAKKAGAMPTLSGIPAVTRTTAEGEPVSLARVRCLEAQP